MTESAILAAKLKSEGQKLTDFFSGLQDSHWSVEVYAEGTVWTVRNALAHLATTERAFVKLFDQIQRGGHGVSEDFSIDRYNASQQRKTMDLSPRQLIEQYEAARREMVALVSGMSDMDLDQEGRHPFMGVTTLREMVKMIYIHNQMHHRDIRRALKA